MTCTPYGVNTHRLLVRGTRIENIEKPAYIGTEAFKISTFIVTPLVALPIILVILIIIVLQPVNTYNIKKIKERYIYPSKTKGGV